MKNEPFYGLTPFFSFSDFAGKSVNGNDFRKRENTIPKA
jgi:hypothetical protein